MLQAFKKKQKKESIVLFCIINSYSIEASFYKNDKVVFDEHQSELLFSYKKKISRKLLKNENSLQKKIGEDIKEVLYKCSRFSPTYDTLIFSIGDPWIRIMTRTAHLEKKDSFEVTQKIIDDLVEKETRLFEQDIIKKFKDREEVGLVDITVPIVDLNGYRVDDYVLQKARTVDIHLTFSIAPIELLEVISSVVQDVFHRTDTHFQSFLSSQKNISNTTAKKMIITTSGTCSTCVIVNQGIPSCVITIPLGIHDFENGLENAGFNEKQQDRSLSNICDSNIIDCEQEVLYQDLQKVIRQQEINLLPYIESIKRSVSLPENTVLIIDQEKWKPIIKLFFEKMFERSITTYEK